MAYIADNALAAAVAASQGLTGPDVLPPQWGVAIPSANLRAYNRLRAVMRKRGFTTAQIDLWDDREDWNRTLGVCLACWDVSKSSEDRGEAFRREWDALLKELMEADLTIGGEVVFPTLAATLRIGSGEYDTADDLHTLDDVL